MHEHHRQSIERVTTHFADDPEILALLLGGSIAHGFAAASSDIDILLVVADSAYETRLRSRRLQFLDFNLCTYEGGCVDGKYLSRSFLDEVARRGSEPARFAFADAHVLSSRIDGLDEILRAITRYPVEGKTDRMRRFYAQFETWHWYAHEGRKWNDRHLLGIATAKMVLFGGRLILAHNEIFYPYHKWFLRLLERAPDKPPDLLARIAAVHHDPSEDNLRALYSSIAFFRTWAGDTDWPVQFLLDTELSWVDGRCPVDDL